MILRWAGGEAVRAGVVTRHELARWYTHLYRGVFVRKGAEVSLRDRAIGAWLATGREGVIAGVAASALLGAPWVDPGVVIEVAGVARRSQKGLVTRRKDRRQYVKDIARLKMLEVMDWIVVRVIAEDDPEVWVTRVEAALRTRGYPLRRVAAQPTVPSAAA